MQFGNHVESASCQTGEGNYTLYGVFGNGLTIGPRIDAPGPLFVTEPDAEDELVDEFIDPRSGAKVDAKTGEVL